MRILCAAYFLLAASLSAADDRQAKIDAAIGRGVGFILRATQNNPKQYVEEKALYRYALISAGLYQNPQNAKSVKTLILDATEAFPFWKSENPVYNASITAMSFAMLDPKASGNLLRACVSYLEKMQQPNGEWGYGEQIVDISSLSKHAASVARTDLSNSQFAALGLLACARAGVRINRGAVEKGRYAWVRRQHPTGAWPYTEESTDLPTRSGVVAGVSSLLAYRHILKDSKGDEAIKKGLKWLESDYTPLEPLDFKKALLRYFYLYGLERIGALENSKSLFGHTWYEDKADYLLGAQEPDGSWGSSGAFGNSLVNTSLAILFLKRATTSLLSEKGLLPGERRPVMTKSN